MATRGGSSAYVAAPLPSNVCTSTASVEIHLSAANSALNNTTCTRPMGSSPATLLKRTVMGKDASIEISARGRLRVNCVAVYSTACGAAAFSTTAATAAGGAADGASVAAGAEDAGGVEATAGDGVGAVARGARPNPTMRRAMYPDATTPWPSLGAQWRREYRQRGTCRPAWALTAYQGFRDVTDNYAHARTHTLGIKL